jgi:ribonuclease P protein component
MLKKENRLTKKNEFDNVFKRSKASSGRFVFLKVLENDLGISRFGFIVSSKISKRAVIRNKIKRRLREIIQKNIINIEKGLDVVILARPNIINCDFGEIKEDTERLFKKLKIL